MCKGIGCHWKKTCSRYVLGKAAGTANMEVEWMDHCLHTSKFVRIGNEKEDKV